FQWWAVSLVNAQPFRGKKKGADTGIDGIKFFTDLDHQPHEIIVSVKGGSIAPDDVRALNHVREREKADIALFISLERPTPTMIKDAASAGLYTSVNEKIKVPRVQLLTIAELLDGTKRAQHPDYDPGMSFKKAEAEEHGEQPGLI
ncbi:MAG: restriction endonuclease, partial [Chthoniobacterales bacterium]